MIDVSLLNLQVHAEPPTGDEAEGALPTEPDESKPDNSRAEQRDEPAGKPTQQPNEERRRGQSVLLLAPTPQDAAHTTVILGEQGIPVRVCHSFGEVCHETRRGALVAIVAEEFLPAGEANPLVGLLAEQPPWSDFPVVVLLGKGSTQSQALTKLQTTGNVTLVDRPLRIGPFVNLVRAKVRDRERQHSVRDLLEHRSQAEERVSQSEKRLSMALRSAGMAAWEWSPNGSVWSDSLYELIGVSRELTASPELFFESVHPADVAEMKAVWNRVTEKREPYDHEFRIVLPSGKVRWIKGVGEFQYDESGVVEQIHGLNWDITDQKRAELREQRSQQREHFLSEATVALSATLDYEKALANTTKLCVPAIADWAFLDLFSDAGGAESGVRRCEIAFANPEHAKLAERVRKFPAKRQTLDHPPAQGLFGGEGVLIQDFTEEMLIRSAQNADHERTLREVDPRSFIVVPLEVRGERLGVLTLLVCRPRRSYRTADLRLAEELARRASIAIDNARLHQATQQAAAAKSAFIATMSHEIRTPMTAVLGYADLLADSERDPEKLNHLTTIRRNGAFLLELINDILDLSKIEAGKMETSREAVSLHALVQEVASMMGVRAAERGIGLSIEYEGRLPRTIQSDPKRLRQVLVNLIGNAIKFTKVGGVLVVCRYLGDRDPPGCQIDVIDTGIGISAEQQARLFEAFAQGDASISRSFGGTGLGLAISRRLAALLGGDIRVESQLGQGSKFSLTIDTGTIDAADLIDPTTLAEPEGDDSQREMPSLACRVLVVDDRRDVLVLTRTLLRRAGAEVVTAHDGLDGIEKIEQHGEGYFDLVLLDMQMPRLDGYETAKRLRAQGYAQPIVALTAEAMEGDIRRCLECGCNDYLSKPIDVRQLLEKVAHYVGTDSES